MLLEKSITYANDVISGKEIAPREVKIECERFLTNLEKQKEEDFLYYFDEEKIKDIEELFKIINMATGIHCVGQSLYDTLQNFQCFYFANVFGWRTKKDRDIFKHKEIVLFIPRKNAKTFICAVSFIILLLTEPKYSKFYSICLDRELASLVKNTITEIILSSPLLTPYFILPKTITGLIKCKLTENTYQARTATANSNNGIQPSAFVADEIGAFNKVDNIQAMQSGQLSVKNPLMFKITTAYAEDKSIMLDELDYLKKIYNGTEKDDRLFSLLYYADKKNLWTEKGLYMANPLRIEENYETIRRYREKALVKEGEATEYLTKHMNHFLPSFSGEEYINIEKVKECGVKEIDFKGREVYVGIDLALTTDNVGVTIAALDDDGKTILVDSWAFIPSLKVEEKSRKERTNYRNHIKEGHCFPCGEDVIDYAFVEKFVIDLEKNLGCEIVAIGYDKYNAVSSVQKFEAHGYSGVEIKQHHTILHPVIKLVEEKVYNKEIKFVNNKLLFQNFQNARLVYNSNMDKYINRKRSTGKIDMVMALFDAVYLLNERELLKEDFICEIL